VLPALQTAAHDPQIIDEFDIWFDREAAWTSENSASIGELLTYFFYHYSTVVPSLPNVYGNIAEGCL
jgi:hypothetical protein